MGLSPPILMDTNWKRNFRRKLLAWFRRNARDLPWRRTRDPYAIWVSEIMLQQTQVSTVEQYFPRFIERFPDIRTLASADEQDVLRLWEGLGYYRRARALYQAARIVMDKHGGQFPLQKDDVVSLPGIGRYTAGAILSIAKDAREPILETNTTRLLSRLLAYRGDPTSHAGRERLWATAEQLLPRTNVGAFNQALMDLGSEICTPRSPVCQDCPLASLCPTHARGLEDVIPARKKKVAYENIRQAAIVICWKSRVLLRRCGPDERWSGLWDFPRFTIKARGRISLEKELNEKTREMTGIEIEVGRRLTRIKHGVTRYRITLDCHEARFVSGETSNFNKNEQRWVSPRQLGRLPLSSTGRKISHLLQATQPVR